MVVMVAVACEDGHWAALVLGLETMGRIGL